MILEQLATEHNFYLTDEQRHAIVTTGIGMNQLQFSADGMVSAIKFGDYDVSFYTFRKDGSYVVETRDFASDGWETATYNKEVQ